MTSATLRNRRAGALTRGFTLVEVLIAVAILAVLVAAVMPSFTADDRQRLNAAAMHVSSDIEFAQVMTIANPQNPLVVRFDGNRIRYWIAYAHSPDDPIDRPGTEEPYVVVFGEGRAEALGGVRMVLYDISDMMLEFESHGGLADFTLSPNISLTVGSTYPRARIMVAPTTGTISVTYQPRAP